MHWLGSLKKREFSYQRKLFSQVHLLMPQKGPSHQEKKDACQAIRTEGQEAD
jgi:hypothetical protein